MSTWRQWTMTCFLMNQSATFYGHALEKHSNSFAILTDIIIVQILHVKRLVEIYFVIYHLFQ